MEINDRNIKLFSTGFRQLLTLITDVAKKMENLMVVTCDVSTSAV